MHLYRMKLCLALCLFAIVSQPSHGLAARITSITTCEKVTQPDMKAVGVKSRFSPDAPEIHLLAMLEQIKSGSKLKCNWISVDAIATPNHQIDTAETVFQKDGEGTAHFSLTRPAKGWPPGNYKIDLYLDGDLLTSVPFSILAPASSSSSASTSPPSTQVPAPKLLSLITCQQVTDPGTIPVNPTDTFDSASEEIHVLAKIGGARAGMKARGVWTAIEGFATPNQEINSTEVDLPNGDGIVVHFSVTKPEGGWPPGKYKFDLLLEGKMVGTVPFTVQGVSSPEKPLSMDLGPAQKDPQRAWTIAVYLDGDNDLEAFALKDLKEMERGMPDQGVECIVLIDRAEGFSNAEGDWTDARVYRVRKDASEGIKSQLLAKLGEVNMGDPNVLKTFLATVLKTFPAQHHALVLWDHGGGWAAHAIDHKAPGSPSGQDKLTLPKLREAIGGALQEAKMPKLDLVGFDMCLMAQLETAYELSGLAEIMLASEAVEPGDGWPYDQILPAFAKGTLGVRRVAAQVVEDFGKFYGERKERVATLSAIDLNEVDKVTAALSAFAAKAAGAVPTAWSDMSRAFFYAEGYAERTDIRKGSGVLASVDLLDMLKRLHQSLPSFPAEKEYQDIVNNMDRAILAKYTSPRHRLSNGMALYAPVRGSQFNPDYLQTRLGQEGPWSNLLAALYKVQQQNLTVPRVTEIKVVDAQSGKPLKGGKPGGGFRIEATVEGENVLWVQYLEGVRDEKNKGLLLFEKSYVYDPEYYKKKQDAVADVVDLIMPEFKGKSNKVGREFLGRHLSVTDGQRAARATLDATSLSDLDHVAVPVSFKRPGSEPCFASVFFNLITWSAANVVAEIPQRDGSVAYRQVQPQADDEVTLLFEFIPDEGTPGYLAGQTLKWGKGLELVIDTDEPSEIVVAMRAESVGGKSSFASTTVQLEALTKEEQTHVENARKVKMKDLIGKWQWHGLKDGQWKPIPAYTEIAPSPSSPDLLVAKINNPGDANWKVTPMMVVLDTRLMPTLRLITFSEEGRPVEAMNFTMLVSRWEKGSPRLVLKYLVPKGWLLLWAKEQGKQATPAPAATGPPATAPPPAASPPPPQPPPQQQSASLVGVWQGEEGDIIKIGPSSYELYGFGRLVDKGSYEIRGKQLITRSAVTRDVERYTFSLSGQLLLLKDSDGQISRYHRKQ